MFCATVKIAYGFYTTSKNLARNLTKNEVIHELQTLVKNNFNVEPDADIQIVLHTGGTYSELGLEMREFVVEDEMFFYARIIRKFHNIEYIKTDIDDNGIQRACYLKKQDLEERRQTRHLVEADILTGAQVEVAVQPTESLCVICSENEVYHERRFECDHLFCSNCHSQWLISSSQYNCPLCRR
jgi:hypothetical protein